MYTLCAQNYIFNMIIPYLQSYTALHEAVSNKKLNIVQLLVGLGADITVKDLVSYHMCRIEVL